MGIVGLQPRQLAPTVGMTGSGSTKLAGSFVIFNNVKQIVSVDLHQQSKGGGSLLRPCWQIASRRITCFNIVQLA
jgi:hypothetical protein